MGASVYDVLYRRYKLRKKLKRPQEALAQAIAASGKLRIDAEHEANFVRLLMPSERVNLTFSQLEISDPALFKRSQGRLMAVLSKRHKPDAAAALCAQYMDKVKADLKKLHDLAPKAELMMARALVCCNELPVIRLIHQEGAEIFISFGDSVGDVMDIARWQEVGENSGLQSVKGEENSVYVSCGGNPLLEEDERRHTGDGHAALARFMIIAGQETGHNADMIRDEKGRWVGRHSATGWGAAPSKKAGTGRLLDIKRTNQLFSRCQKLGLRRIAEWERQLKFYREHNVTNWRRKMIWLASRMGWQVFRLLLKARGLHPLSRLQRSPYPCTQLATFFPDMLFNLAPEADVYRSKNPREQEATACIEAVARVPQQVVKWGHEAVRFCQPSLYAFYYSDIVPACEKALQQKK